VEVVVQGVVVNRAQKNLIVLLINQIAVVFQGAPNIAIEDLFLKQLDVRNCFLP
jgi:hypothetical protein